MVLKVISRHRNRRPAGTVLAANDSFTMRDSRACLEALVRRDQSCSSVRSSSSLIWGELDLLSLGVQFQPEKGEGGSWPIHLVHGHWDTQALTHLQQLLEVGGILGGPRRISEEVVVQVVDYVGEAIVVAEYPLEGISVLVE